MADESETLHASGSDHPAEREQIPIPSLQTEIEEAQAPWLFLGGATLSLIAWADDHYNSQIARTMGLTSFAIANVMFSLTTRDERRSVFSLDVFEDRTFLLCTGDSFAAIVLGTELRVFQRIRGTVHLNLHQWLLCIVVGLAIVPVSEIRRLLLQRRGSAAGASGEVSTGGPAESTAP